YPHREWRAKSVQPFAQPGRKHPAARRSTMTSVQLEQSKKRSASSLSSPERVYSRRASSTLSYWMSRRVSTPAHSDVPYSITGEAQGRAAIVFLDLPSHMKRNP